MPTQPNIPHIFIAYSRKDTAYLDELRTHLTPLERTGKLKIWYDGKIEPGSVWETDIKMHLHGADIILMLVSADAIASDYFYEKEMAEALARHQSGEAKVVPLILRNCAWRATQLGELQALPKNGKAVSTWLNRDDAYSDAVEQLWGMVRQVEERQESIEAKQHQQAEQQRLHAEQQRQAKELARKQEEERQRLLAQAQKAREEEERRAKAAAQLQKQRPIKKAPSPPPVQQAQSPPPPIAPGKGLWSRAIAPVLRRCWWKAVLSALAVVALLILIGVGMGLGFVPFLLAVFFFNALYIVPAARWQRKFLGRAITFKEGFWAGFALAFICGLLMATLFILLNSMFYANNNFEIFFPILFYWVAGGAIVSAVTTTVLKQPSKT